MGACVCAPTVRNKVLAKEEEEGWEKVEDAVFLNGKYCNFVGNECGLRLVDHERS